MPSHQVPPQTPPAATASQSPKPWYQNERLSAFLELAQKVIVILGVPLGIYTFVMNKAKERQEAEWITYEKMDDRYWTYERLSMDYPLLNVSDAGASDPALAKLTKARNELTPEERIRERQMMIMLIAMYERAYILYANKSTEFRERQWGGWDNGLKRWCKAAAFREAWNQIGEDLDKKYQEHVNLLLTDAQK